MQNITLCQLATLSQLTEQQINFLAFKSNQTCLKGNFKDNLVSLVLTASVKSITRKNILLLELGVFTFH